MKDARLWIALTRPDNLVNALAIAASSRGDFASCSLLYEDSSWWGNARWDEFRPWFDEVYHVAKIPTCRGLRDVPRFYRAMRARQRSLAELRVSPRDTVVTLAGITGLSNAVSSAYPGVNKVLCLTLKKYEDASRAADFSRYRHTTSSWLQHRFLEPRAGLNRTLHLKPWRGGGDGARLERLEKALEEVYEAIVILSNRGDELPAAAGSRLFPAPFPDLTDFARWLPAAQGERAASTGRKVVFFGTPFLLVRNLSPEQYASRLNECLDYLRLHHGKGCELVYRPHPAETRERERLRLEGFRFEDDREVAELYFLKNFTAIEAVYSVSSTVSRVAFNYGLDGYCLWRCFPFAERAATYFATLMGAVPEPFEIRSLDAAPVSYAGRGGIGWKRGSFPGTLQGVLGKVEAGAFSA